MFDNLDDPQKQAMLMLAAGLLSPVRSRGAAGFGEAMSQGIQGGLLGFNNASREKRRGEGLAQETALRKMQLEEAQRGQEFQKALAGGYRPGGPIPYNDATGNEGQQGPVGNRPESFDMSAAMQIDPMKAMALKQSMTPKPKMQFAPNGQAVDMNALQHGQDFAPPVKQPDWKDPEYIKAQQAIRAAGRSNISTTTNVLPQREVFKDSLGLKKDFDGQPEVKGFKEVQTAWDQISGAIKNPSAANDLASATKFMKLLDPNSVVRESELAMAMQASGKLDYFMNTANRIMTGEKLTPKQRADFYSAGEALYNASKDRYGQTVEQYSGIAKQYGLDPQFIQNAQPRKRISGWSIQRTDQ